MNLALLRLITLKVMVFCLNSLHYIYHKACIHVTPQADLFWESVIKDKLVCWLEFSTPIIFPGR